MTFSQHWSLSRSPSIQCSKFDSTPFTSVAQAIPSPSGGRKRFWKSFVKILGCGRPGLRLSLVVRLLAESRLSEKWKSPVLGDERGRRFRDTSPRLSGQLLLLEAHTRADFHFCEPVVCESKAWAREEATRRRTQQRQAAFGSVESKNIEESKVG